MGRQRTTARQTGCFLLLAALLCLGLAACDDGASSTLTLPTVVATNHRPRQPPYPPQPSPSPALSAPREAGEKAETMTRYSKY